MSESKHPHPPCGAINPVMPEWIFRLPYQQQSVLMLGSRGPDGVRKNHPIKILHACYRGCVFKAAYFGRELRNTEQADTFMTRDELTDAALWEKHVKSYFDYIDELPHHYHMHLMHGAQIMGYKHPLPLIRTAWNWFYMRACEAMHVHPETEAQMDGRLSDWGRKHWDE